MTTAGSSKSRMLDSCSRDDGAVPSPATIWQRFARMLGIEERHAEDALHSERVAKHVVTRRSFIGAAGALAGASLFSFASVGDDEAARMKAEFDKKISVERGKPEFGSFMQAKIAEIDALYAAAGENLARFTWGNAGGAIGGALT